MMTHLQEINRPGATPHLLLCWKSRVACEQRLECTELDEEHQGIFIDILTPAGPKTGSTEGRPPARPARLQHPRETAPAHSALHRGGRHEHARRARPPIPGHRDWP